MNCEYYDQTQCIEINAFNALKCFNRYMTDFIWNQTDPGDATKLIFNICNTFPEFLSCFLSSLKSSGRNSELFNNIRTSFWIILIQYDKFSFHKQNRNIQLISLVIINYQIRICLILYKIRQSDSWYHGIVCGSNICLSRRKIKVVS